MLGSESTIEGAEAEARGGRIALVEREGSKRAAILYVVGREMMEKLRSPGATVCRVE